ncbi:flagellar brake protein [Burkholderia pseudomallei]|uniref:flagellar brake protein n=1 Tax=Burkholderia pseudomallei TaxID=28450 RepID=UPI0003AB1757|nr:flagellar brake protein [Burkholderia pseudomallei]KIX63572.1 flagellar brake protein [Burkholderia pseudomallei]MBF3452107.1 flagellar brake protein [Burkholderia pseudomallei]MBF3478053.1 flagellar brake protein [Burkholderia pseudomallei]MBF3509611.1 flagellar brake protein [Burkholderia pseudomallei]MBF3514613.1 flagellar brake protein [Burkholderia pseudomallei]
MNTEQSTSPAASAAAHSGHDYGRRNPLEIGVQLRNLVNRGDFLTVQYQGGQLVTRILDVDVGARTFVFDWGALADQNAGILAAPRCVFDASPDGVRVEFSTATPREIRYENLPAFEADFPDVLYCMQRREYFRVDAPILDPYVCRGRLPDGETFLFEVHNLSLGGLGLRTSDDRVASLEPGMTLPDVELNLNGHGMLSLDLQLVSHRASETPSGARRYQLGFRFVSLPGSAENTLQRIITQLEMKRRQLARA